MKRDVQVIPAYLAYLVHANAWLTSDMLGNVVLTKTSLVRRFAKTDIGKLTYEKDNKKGYITLLNSMERLCLQEFPMCFNQYAIRKAAFRGGLTFTCANNANRVWHNVVSLDVTSMHHTFINGRYIPVHFGLSNPIALQRVCTNIVNTTLEEVLENYHKPFDSAIHALIRFTNLRLKKDTIFEQAGIGIIPESKARAFLSADNVSYSFSPGESPLILTGFLQISPDAWSGTPPGQNFCETAAARCNYENESLLRLRSKRSDLLYESDVPPGSCPH